MLSFNVERVRQTEMSENNTRIKTNVQKDDKNRIKHRDKSVRPPRPKPGTRGPKHRSRIPNPK